MSIDYSAGVLYKGNTYRLKKLMEAAKKGGSYTIGFIGGSITQGARATDITKCYAYHVYEWWVNTFKNASFKIVNAGIGATDSQFASARVASDLLTEQPDFVITEFSVNDENTLHFRETYEGLVRQVLLSENKPALITMNNIFYDTGANAEEQHVTVAKHYNVPALGVRPSIYKEIVDGNIQVRDVTEDDLHPNDYGHGLVASQITYFLDVVFKSSVEDTNDVIIPSPLTINTYEKSYRLNNKNAEPITEGFIPDYNKQEGFWDCFKNGWTAKNVGASIVFRVVGTNFSVQYRKSYIHPVPIAKLTMDGDESKAIILDANFDETWGDKLFLTTIAEHMDRKEHEIKIEIIEAHEEDTAPFYLAAILVSE